MSGYFNPISAYVKGTMKMYFILPLIKRFSKDIYVFKLKNIVFAGMGKFTKCKQCGSKRIGNGSFSRGDDYENKDCSIYTEVAICNDCGHEWFKSLRIKNN